MSESYYHHECLRCGGPLVPNALGPDTPPWRCDECHKSYWVGELTQEARKHYRRHQHDFGLGGTPGHKYVREAVAKEQHEALMRGVSVRRDQLGLIPKGVLLGLLERHKGRIEVAFAKAMREQAA